MPKVWFAMCWKYNNKIMKYNQRALDINSEQKDTANALHVKTTNLCDFTLKLPQYVMDNTILYDKYYSI